jgi:hypothetical protein
MRYHALCCVAGWLIATHVLSAQAPGSGWATVPTPERTVKTLYWQLFNETEVWIRLVPEKKNGDSIPVSLVFIAILPGRVTLPASTTDGPREIVLLAQPDPLAVLPAPNPTLRFTTDDGADLDMVRLGIANRPLACDGCTNQPIRARLSVETLRTIARSKTISCDVWGLNCELSLSDTDALRAFGRALAVYR